MQLTSKNYWLHRSEVTLPSLEGVVLSTESAGIKYKNRDDLLLIYFPQSAAVAGIFTKSLCCSAPVDWCKQNLPQGRAKAVIVNSGNANAFTGVKGAQANIEIAGAIASTLNCSTEEIFQASTGVIGEPLNYKLIIDQLVNLKANFDDSSKAWEKAAAAIMTTDSFAKYATRSFTLDGEEITINAIAKGSGMIAPDMATMLAFIVTDAAIDAAVLQQMLFDAGQVSFNAVTVDSDCSTSDTVLCFSTEKKLAEKPIRDLSDPRTSEFFKHFVDLAKELALQIVCDGEGAEHLIKVEVCGAKDADQARKIAFSIGNSPLVKTAIAGNDANWGRVVMAVGKSGQDVERDKLSIYFGEYCVAQDGARANQYDEAKLSQYMKNYQIDIKVDLGIGDGCATIWSCDLTAEYVAINADYRS